MDEPPLDTTADGTLLEGRIRYRQLRAGYRTGLEPVLLAASVPAKPGERVVEAGTGAGAGLLCLASRVDGITGVGLEIDAGLAALAAENFAANGLRGLRADGQDVTTWRDDATFDHAFANPPWHEAAGTNPVDGGRRLAKMAKPGLLALWVESLAAVLRRRGTLSLILPAASISCGMAALRAVNCGEITTIPIWPHAGESARLAILRGVRNGKGKDLLLAGLVLHKQGAGLTEAAEHILRDGAPLS